MSEQSALYSSLYGESRSSKAPENQNGRSGEDSYSPSVHSPNSIKAEKGEESAVLAQSQWPPASLEEASTSQLIHRHSTSAANKSEKRMVNRPDRTESVHTEKTYEEPALFSQNKNLEATLQEMKQSLREEFDCIIQESLQDFKEEIKEMLKKEKKLIRKSIQTALQEEKNRIIDLVQLVQDAVSEDRQQSTQQQSGLQGEKFGQMSPMMYPDAARYYAPTMTQVQPAYFVSNSMPRLQTTVPRTISMPANGWSGTPASHQNVYVSQCMSGQSQESVKAPSRAVVNQEMEPLTATMLATAPPQEKKQMLGERLYPLISRLSPDMAGKITGMLLEFDNTELLHLLESQESLEAKVKEAVEVLQRHNVRVSTSHV